MQNPWPQLITKISFLDKENVGRGYIDLSHYNNNIDKILFNNLSIGDFDISQYENRFFRDGDIGLLQDGGIKTHTHSSEPHTHTYICINKDVKETKRGDTTGSGSDMKNVVRKNKENKTTESLSITLDNTGEEKTSPKHIIGRYIVKCW